MTDLELLKSKAVRVRRVEDRFAIILTEEVAAALARLSNGTLSYREGGFYQLYSHGSYFTMGERYFVDLREGYIMAAGNAVTSAWKTVEE